jgi:hypothetical protein
MADLSLKPLGGTQISLLSPHIIRAILYFRQHVSQIPFFDSSLFTMNRVILILYFLKSLNLVGVK